MTAKTAEQTAIRRALPMNGTTAPESTKRGFETDACNASILLGLSDSPGTNSLRRPLVATEQGIS